MKARIWASLSRWFATQPLIGLSVLGVLVTTLSVTARSQVVNSKQNPLQIALLHWYAANQTTSFLLGGAGGTPMGLAFDGANIWVGDWYYGTVSKVRPSDGAILNVFSPGAAAWGLGFDGANVWITDVGIDTCSGRLVKMRPSDGTVLASATVGLAPTAVAFDGANVWTVNSGCSSGDPITVTKVRASDGFNLGTFNVGGSQANCVGGAAGVEGIAFDGANIWVPSNSNGQGIVTKLRISDGKALGQYQVGSCPTGVVFDGTNVWVSSYGASTVTKLRASDGFNLGIFSVGTEVLGLTFDGANIWVAWGISEVTKLRASDGQSLGTFSAGPGSLTLGPTTILFDGAHIWIGEFYCQGENTPGCLNKL